MLRLPTGCGGGQVTSHPSELMLKHLPWYVRYSPMEAVQHLLPVEHPAVQVDRRAPAGCCVVLGV